MRPARACLVAAAAALAGASASSVEMYDVKCYGVFRSVTDQAMREIDQLAETVDRGEVCPALGSKADSLCNQALERFSSEMPDPEDDQTKEALFDEKVEELERALDLPLQVVFMKQLLLLRDRALQRFKAAAKGSEQADYQAMVAAATFFDKEARASVKQGSSWDFARERQALTSTMAELAQRTKRTADAQLKAAQAQNTAFAFLQAQQQQIAQLQQQMYGGGNSPWGLSAAYRIPDTAIDVQGSYQGGGASVTFSCAADDQNPMLGASGFTQGFGPGNVGLTLKVNI